MDVITKTKELTEACHRLAQSAFITIDTEFMRESSYWSKLCLIQMAGPDKEPVLVDPLSEALSLDPFWGLMHDQSVTKVFHAARQDIEIIVNGSGEVPGPIFDTQVAATVCGFGESISYDQLVRRTARAEIDKSSRFTDWSRRPLTDKQLNYAAADVTHLVDAYGVLKAMLDESGRAGWLDEEMAILTSPETYANDPANAWKRLKNRARKPRELARLQALAAWREEQAQERDVPRGRILKDDALYELALQGPADEKALARLRAIPRGFERSRDGGALIAVLQSVEDIPKEALPKLPRHSRNAETPAAVTDLLKTLLKHIGEKEGVAPRMIASADDIDALARDDEADIAALKGWRRELFGQVALKLKRGEIGLALKNGELEVIDLTGSD